MMKKPLLVSAVMAGLFLLTFTASCDRSPTVGLTEDDVPLIQPVTLDDLYQQLELRQGRVVLLNVWATWCVPCREEFPDLLRLRRDFAPRGFELVLVSADFESQLPQAREFLAEKGVDFETYHKRGPDQEFIDGLDSRWSGALPASILYAADGTKAEFWEGKITYDELARRIEPLLPPAA